MSNSASVRSQADIHYSVVETLTKVLDKRFSILGFRFGFDPIIGLIPWIGDFVTLILSLYMVYVAVLYRVPREAIARMIFNVVFDFLLGLIPVIGDAADFVHQANAKNIKILREYIIIAPIKGETVKEG